MSELLISFHFPIWPWMTFSISYCVWLPLCLPASVSVCLCVPCLCVSMPLCLHASVSACLCVCMLVFYCQSLSLCLLVSLYVCLPVCSISLPLLDCISVCLSSCLLVFLSVCISIRLYSSVCLSGCISLNELISHNWTDYLLLKSCKRIRFVLMLLWPIQLILNQVLTCIIKSDTARLSKP